MAQPPGSPVRRPRPTQLSPYLGYLTERWAQGCHHACRRSHELVQRGYRGAATRVRVVVRPWRTRQEGRPPVLTAGQLSRRSCGAIPCWPRGTSARPAFRPSSPRGIWERWNSGSGRLRHPAYHRLQQGRTVFIKTMNRSTPLARLPGAQTRVRARSPGETEPTPRLWPRQMGPAPPAHLASEGRARHACHAAPRSHAASGCLRVSRL
jgi:hypothetical protein